MESRFQEYIDDVCGGIRGAHRRAEISDELLSHLEERYEQNLAVGLDADAAEADAVAHMGSREALRKTFSALYPFSSIDYLRSALNFLMTGLLFSHIHLNFFVGSEQLTTLLGQFLLFYALFKLYTADRYLQTALVLYVLYLSGSTFCTWTAYYCLPAPPYLWFLQIAVAVLLAAAYGFLFAGLHRLCRQNPVEGTKEPHLLFCGAIPIGIQLFFITVLTATDSGSEIQLSGLEGYFLLFSLLIVSAGLQRAKKRLCHTESPFILRAPLQKRGKLCYALLSALLLVVLPLGSMCHAAMRAPETAPYVRQDVETADADVNEARENMRRLGFPEAYLNDLPDSEILHYQHAAHMTVCREEEMLARFAEEAPTDTQIRAYAFFFPKEALQTEGDALRMLYVLENFDAQSFHGRDGFYFQFSDRDFWAYAPSVRDSAQFPAFFSLILADCGGKTVSAAPLYTVPYQGKGGIPNTYTGCEFAFPRKAENRRAYFADTAQLRADPEKSSSYNSGYVSAVSFHKQAPFYLLHNNTLKLAEQQFSADMFSLMFQPSDPTVAKYNANCFVENADGVPEKMQ